MRAQRWLPASVIALRQYSSRTFISDLIPELWRQGWTDRLVWMVTFALTVLAGFTVAVEAGMILAALLFIRRVSTTTTVRTRTR